MVLQCINGVSSNPVEGRTKIWQLKNLILTLFGLIFRHIYLYIKSLLKTQIPRLLQFFKSTNFFPIFEVHVFGHKKYLQHVFYYFLRFNSFHLKISESYREFVIMIQIRKSRGFVKTYIIQNLWLREIISYHGNSEIYIEIWWYHLR